MKRYLSKRKGLFYFTLVLILASDLIIAGSTVLKQILVDAVLALDTKRVIKYIPLVVGYALFSGVIYVISNVYQHLFSAKITDDMRKTVFSGILKRKHKDFSTVNYSDYISALIGDLNIIERQYLGMLFMIIVFGANLVLSAVLMFCYQSVVAIAAMTGAAVMTVVPMMLGKYLGKLSKEYSQKLSGLTTCLTELFSGFQVISSFGIWNHAKSNFDYCSSELKNAECKANGMSAFSDGLAQLLSVTAQAMILTFACYMVLHKHMTMGALVAFLSLNQTFCGALSMVLRSIPMLHSVHPVIERINAFADYQQNVGGKEPCFHKKLEVKNLAFQYCEGKPVLSDITLTIQPGDKCALIGESGSGKTTFIRLLTGELDGYKGEISYDGVNLNEVDCEKICKIVSVIHQDVFLFDDTIRNNICLYDEFTDEEFIRAVKLSGVNKFIDQLAQGAEYRVGQRGEFLSGGQRQRIAIARALIRNTPFLILDEGTSALDAKTGLEIESELMAIPELTVLTITHNLRNAEEYNHIYSLKSGKIQQNKF